MPKGTKICKVCGISTGPRAYICPNGHGFTIHGKKFPDCVVAEGIKELRTAPELKFRKQRNFTTDWQKLLKGDVVRVSGGPIWMRPIDNGGPLAMGYKGIFKVKHLDSSGIHAYPIKAKNEAGFCYIYCGPEKIMSTGTIMRPHDVVKVKAKNGS